MIQRLPDPLKLGKVLWPGATPYREQREIAYSVHEEADETVVGAANMVGKDWIAGFIVLIEFLIHPVARIVTTSVKDDHLRVLWGEIGRFIQSASQPLTVDKGGCLIFNHREIRKVREGNVCPISYVRGMVSERGEGLAGHHAPYTLAVIDEASGVPNMAYNQMRTWAKKMLIFGNCNPCVDGMEHFFYKSMKQGDIIDPHSIDEPSPSVFANVRQ